MISWQKKRIPIPYFARFASWSMIPIIISRSFSLSLWHFSRSPVTFSSCCRNISFSLTKPSILGVVRTTSPGPWITTLSLLGMFSAMESCRPASFISWSLKPPDYRRFRFVWSEATKLLAIVAETPPVTSASIDLAGREDDEREFWWTRIMCLSRTPFVPKPDVLRGHSSIEHRKGRWCLFTWVLRSASACYPIWCWKIGLLPVTISPKSLISTPRISADELSLCIPGRDLLLLRYRWYRL